MMLLSVLMSTAPRAEDDVLEFATRGPEAVSPIELTTVVRVSDRIARVRVTERTPVPLFWIFGQKFGAGHESCGDAIRVEVVESLKGGMESFEFFLPNPSDFEGADRDYLVFVRKRDRDSDLKALRDLDDLLAASAVNRLRCMTYGEYYVPVQHQLMIAFAPDKDASGEDWLMAPQRDSVLWCDSSEGPPTGAVVFRHEMESGERRESSRWAGLRRLLGHAIRFDLLPWRQRLQGC